ncbi:MAG: SIR2 family protein [Chloroflexi bacterium]|nr:SIR2 family protein [Chloroflexota bacterium]
MMVKFSIIQPPEPLWLALIEGRCVLFVGSGLSIPAEYPSWGSLVSQLIDMCVEHGVLTKDEAKELKEHKDLPEAAGQCRRRLSDEDRYYEMLNQILTPYGRHRYLPTHLDLLDWRAPAYITTNYDPCLENADNEGRGGKRQVRIYPALHPGNLDGGHIHHIHGHISHIKTMILTDDDYHHAYFEDHLLSDFLKMIFESRTVLFIGCGMDDPGIKHILKIAKSVQNRSTQKAREMGLPEFQEISHYALVAEEEKPVSMHDEILFLSYGVQVIRYPQMGSAQGARTYGNLYETIAAWQRQLASKVLEEPPRDLRRYQR